jgi:hypothetical protein
VLVPAVNVPEFDQLPLSLIFEAPEHVTVPPALIVNPAVVHPFALEAPMVTVPFDTVEVPEIVRS